MMPYIVGRDPNTNEIIVGDHRRNVFFLRGSSDEEQAIRNLAQAANGRIHEVAAPDPVNKPTT